MGLHVVHRGTTSCCKRKLWKLPTLHHVPCVIMIIMCHNLSVVGYVGCCGMLWDVVGCCGICGICGICGMLWVMGCHGMSWDVGWVLHVEPFALHVPQLILRCDAQFLGDFAAELRRRHRFGRSDRHGVGQALDLQVPRVPRVDHRGARGAGGRRSGDWGIHLRHTTVAKKHGVPNFGSYAG